MCIRICVTQQQPTTSEDNPQIREDNTTKSALWARRPPVDNTTSIQVSKYQSYLDTDSLLRENVKYFPDHIRIVVHSPEQINRSIDQTIKQLNYYSISQSINQSVSHPVNQPFTLNYALFISYELSSYLCLSQLGAKV